MNRSDLKQGRWETGHWRHLRCICLPTDTAPWIIWCHWRITLVGWFSLWRFQGSQVIPSTLVSKEVRTEWDNSYCSTTVIFMIAPICLMYYNNNIMFYQSKEFGTRCILTTWEIRRTWAWTCRLSVELWLAACSNLPSQVNTVQEVLYCIQTDGFRSLLCNDREYTKEIKTCFHATWSLLIIITYSTYVLTQSTHKITKDERCYCLYFLLI